MKAQPSATESATEKLLEATYQGNVAKIEKILAEAKTGEEKLNIEAESGGFTPLFFAVQNDNKRAVELLLAAGADAKKKTPTGETPQAFARSHSKFYALQALQDHEPEPDPPPE